MLTNQEIDQNIGQTIRARRNAMGMTQENLATALGISYQQVQKYEVGSNRVSGSRIYQIAVALDVEPGALFEGVADKAPQPIGHGGRTRPITNMALAFGQIADPEVRTAIGSLIKTLSKYEFEDAA